MKKYIFLLLAFVLVSCSAGLNVIPNTETPTLTPTVTATFTLTPTPTQIPPTSTPLPRFTSDMVSIEGANELDIVGTLYMPTENSSEPRPAVLLLHMFRSNRRSWRTVAPQLAEAGYVVLAIDMRGHGLTGSTVDWLQAEEDHKSAVAFLASLPEVDKERIGVMGGSIGANMALVAGAVDENVRAVILLSPGLDYFGVTTEDKLSAYGDRPIMIVVSQDDGQTVADAERLPSQAVGEVELIIYETAGHGTRMFSREPELIESILAWLSENL